MNWCWAIVNSQGIIYVPTGPVKTVLYPSREDAEYYLELWDLDPDEFHVKKFTA